MRTTLTHAAPILQSTLSTIEFCTGLNVPIVQLIQQIPEQEGGPGNQLDDQGGGTSTQTGNSVQLAFPLNSLNFLEIL